MDNLDQSGVDFDEIQNQQVMLGDISFSGL